MSKTNKALQISISILCALLLVASFLVVLLPTAGHTVAQAADLSTRQSRLLYFLDRNVKGMNSEYDTEASISSTKTLYDFAGNTYTLVECAPTGYMIMCDDSATMVEYSGTSPSPYFGLTNNLYYGGPSYFYVLENGTYRHTVTGEIFDYSPVVSTYSNDDEQSVDYVANACDEMHNDLVADANESALNFIETGIMPRKEIIGLYGESWTCINNMAFFSSKINSTQIGYKNGGYCGYIAAAMLIGYYDTFIRDCMDDGWLYMSGTGVNRHFTGYGLVDRLFGFGNGKTSSTSTTIREAMNAYFRYYGYNLGSYDMITPFFSGTTLKNLIDKNTPSILFGDLGNATRPNGSSAEIGPEGGNHAVVVYGYKKGGTGGALYSFLAHYGWSNYSMSTINYKSYSVFGSMYRISL